MDEFIDVDRSIKEVDWAEPGTKAGLEMLESFCQERLKYFSTDRNNPTKNALSNLSPWFHAGKYYYLITEHDNINKTEEVVLDWTQTLGRESTKFITTHEERGNEDGLGTTGGSWSWKEWEGALEDTGRRPMLRSPGGSKGMMMTYLFLLIFASIDVRSFHDVKEKRKNIMQ